MELWYRFVDIAVPFDWARYTFMKHALLAVVLATPLLGILGTMVVSHRMVFFSDVLGHSALCGIALGVLFGVRDPLAAMIAFMVVLALLVNAARFTSGASFDTVLGVFFGIVVALGIVILSKGGGFAKYTPYLVGDLLTIAPYEIARLGIIFAAVLVYWVFAGNGLILTGVNPSLAKSRGFRPFLIQAAFSVLLAVVVASCIRLVGILIINSLLVLPSAAARNIASSARSYTAWSVLISLFSGVLGLVASYYGGTATGATIVLFAAFCYVVAVVWSKVRPG